MNDISLSVETPTYASLDLMNMPAIMEDLREIAVID